MGTHYFQCKIKNRFTPEHHFKRYFRNSAIRENTVLGVHSVK